MSKLVIDINMGIEEFMRTLPSSTKGRVKRD